MIELKDLCGRLGTVLRDKLVPDIVEQPFVNGVVVSVEILVLRVQILAVSNLLC